MNRHMYVLMFSVLLPLGAEAQTSTDGVDTSGWECKYCPDNTGWHGEATLSPTWVSDGDPDFGRSSGLDEDGFYLNASGEVVYRNDRGHSWSVQFDDLGLETRSLLIDGGTQGVYRLRVLYDELQRIGPEGSRTPYRGVDSEDLTLPAGWVNGATTAGMTQLDSALRSVSLDRERTRIGVELDMVANSRWEYGFSVTQETKEGLQALGAGFFFNTAQLPAPIDQVTDTMEAELSYTGERGGLVLSYLASLFSNDNSRLNWENAYSGPAGVTEGQLALPPDNQYHLLQVSGNYRIGDTGEVYGNLGMGRSTQDEDFLDSTVNTGLGASAPPVSSLDGEVETLNATLRYTARPRRGMSVLAEFRHVDRDNKTDSNSYTRVVTDAFISTARDNPVYSFTDQDLRLKVRQRINPDLGLSAGADKELRERTDQMVSETDELTLWAKADYQFSDRFYGRLKVSHGSRDATEANNPPVLSPADNPLMRKYNLADRTREAVDLNLGLDLADNVSLSLDYSGSADDYDDSDLGLTDARNEFVNLGFNMAVSEATRLYAVVGREYVRSIQMGSDGGTEWEAKERDITSTVILGISYAPPKSATRLGLDLSRSESIGQISLRQPGNNSELPDLKSTFDQVRLYGEVAMGKQLSLTADLIHQRLASEDWSVDDVDPDTMGNLVGMGAEAQDASVTAVVAGIRYRF